MSDFKNRLEELEQSERARDVVGGIILVIVVMFVLALAGAWVLL